MLNQIVADSGTGTESRSVRFGIIKSVDAGERKLVIKHGPIRALQMPGMTMPFGVAPDVDLSGLAPGAKVKFTLGRDATGIYVIDQIGRAK